MTAGPPAGAGDGPTRAAVVAHRLSTVRPAGPVVVPGRRRTAGPGRHGEPPATGPLHREPARSRTPWPCPVAFLDMPAETERVIVA
ncbi:hypothetical protein SUDANB126_01233 [Streptomyces sp. enrichment culture]